MRHLAGVKSVVTLTVRDQIQFFASFLGNPRSIALLSEAATVRLVDWPRRVTVSDGNRLEASSSAGVPTTERGYNAFSSHHSITIIALK